MTHQLPRFDGRRELLDQLTEDTAGGVELLLFQEPPRPQQAGRQSALRRFLHIVADLFQLRPALLAQADLPQPAPGQRELRILAHHLPPVSFGFGQLAQVAAHGRQVVAGQVAAQCGVDAGEMRSRRRRQHLLPACPGPGPPVPAGRQRLIRLPEQVVRLGQQCVQLADNGIRRVR